jgi:short-subunit dehydrogenase
MQDPSISGTSGNRMTGSPVIIITGASSGIGAATAKLFGQKGYCVVLAARRIERLNLLTEKIRQNGGTALAVPTDITRLEQINQLVDATIVKYGRIDVLLNNAGIGRMNWLESMDPITDISNQINLNLVALIHTTRIVLPHMIQQQKGHILNMASVAGLIATPTYSIYAASKFGVRGFTNALRRELNGSGVKVSGIYPGGVETEFSEQAGKRPNTGVKTPDVIKLTAIEVAETVWSVVQRPRRTVVIPRVMRIFIILNRIFPGFVDWGIHRVVRKKN